MNAQVALKNVLSIWMDKAGLPASSIIEPVSFVTKQNQTFKIFTLQGTLKTILVAVHTGKNHTFFRLASSQQDASLHDKKVQTIFEKLLFDVYIKG